MVFSHRCIPLSVNLREENASTQQRDVVTASFVKLTVAISSALHGNPEPLSEAWDYEYDNLWRHRWGKKPFHMCTPEEQYGILMARTHWCRRLKSHNKQFLKRLLHAGGALKLKEILHTTDGILASLLISYPEVFYSPIRGREYAVADEICNNLISNGLQRYDSTLADLKSFRKRLRKCAFEQRECTLTEHEQRCYGSWLQKVVDLYNPTSKSTSKAKMFRVCVFTQARATGLVGQKGVNDTIGKFLDSVMTPKIFSPDKLLMECIDYVLEEVVTNANGGNPNMRISISTSACTENPKKKEGKFGLIKRSTHEFPPIPKFSPTNEGGQLGNWAFFKAVELVEKQDPSIFKVNVAGIRENGKCRVVTSGSFYKDALLQPFSHMTMQAIKNQRSLRNGLSAGRLGWRFISRVDHLDPVDGHVLFEKVRRVFSVDWEKATDNPTHISAHVITGALLKKMRLPDDIYSAITSLWPGLKDLYVKGKFIGTMANGVPMGDPLTKTNLSLAHPICERYASVTAPGVKIVHDGNGDDTIIILGADTEAIITKWVCAYNSAAEMLGYKLSENDTFTTSSWGTYCEEVFCIPVDRFNTVATASKLKDNRLMPYLDHPKMRLVIDTKKDRSDYSSVIDGKVTLMGKDAWYADNGLESTLFAVASASQDICLGVRYEQKPMYLPHEIFSIGKTPRKWDVVSWTNAIWSQPAKVVNITTLAMKELLEEAPRFLTTHRAVKSAERHFQKELVSEEFQIPEDDPIRQLIVIPREKTHLFPLGVLQRLTDSKHLTTSEEVEGIYLFQKRIQELEQHQHVDLFENLRTKVKQEPEYTKAQVMQTVTKFKDRFYSSRYLLRRPREVDYYFTHHIDELRNSDPRKVSIPGFDYPDRFVKRLPANSPKARAEEELYEWLNKEVENILGEREYSLPPKQLLEDDPIILQEIERSSGRYFIIVTDDRKLVNLARNKLIGRDIARMSIRNWVRIDADEQSVLRALEYRQEPTTIIVDEGNLNAFLMKTDIVPTQYPDWEDDVVLKPPRNQEDIWDVYLAPVTITPENIHSLLESGHSGGSIRRRGAHRRGG